MSLSRAFTTRRARASHDVALDQKLPQRSNTTARMHPVLRHQISAPIQLVHTTNMLSYNAPDLPRATRSNSSTTSKSDSDSDSRATDLTPPSSPDVSPGDGCLEPNHLSTYFSPAVKKPEVGPSAAANVPAIPKRSPSHTKKNSLDALARSRSISHMSRESEQSVSTKASPAFSRTSSTSTRASSPSSGPAPRPWKQAATPAPPPVSSSALSPWSAKEQQSSHPFGQELAQVTELAEEYATKPQVKAMERAMEEDREYIESRGLFKHCASEYLGDIQSLSAKFFPDRHNTAPSTPLWI